VDPYEIAVAYHERTKHHFHRYARSLGYMDWANQPDPFRRYAGAPLIPLPQTEADITPPYDDLYQPGCLRPQPVTLATISEFFFLSLALSAWKQYRSERWALRCNPSSGNLHPTEGYLVIGPVERLSDSAGIYHYAPRAHALELRCSFEPRLWQRLTTPLPPDAFFVGLSSIHWREAWKYGERAYRYCQQDLGHAIAACSFAGAALGWRVCLLHSVGDADIARLLGVDRHAEFHEREHEEPDALLAVIPQADGVDAATVLPRDVIDRIAGGRWHGRASQLSAAHVHWQIIDAVAAACVRPAGAALPGGFPDFTESPPHRRTTTSARTIIRQRRSAVAFDGQTSIAADDFFAILDRTLPRADHPPWSTLGPPALIDLALFVHRVRGLTAGLYCLVRSPARADALQQVMRPEFAWRPPPGCPTALPLYQLATGDCTALAARVSCHQDIAGDGAFSLGLIAEFEQPLRRHGAWVYRRLHWEAGAVGHVLYLEAEAAGVRGTGMGCYFDDPVHDVFGLRGQQFQSVYHFAAGGPVEDARLTTLPAYGGSTS